MICILNGKLVTEALSDHSLSFIVINPTYIMETLDSNRSFSDITMISTPQESVLFRN